MDTPCASVQKVGGILRGAGFASSRYTRSGRVRGWGDNSEGYRVSKYGDSIRVDHFFDSTTRKGSSPEAMLERLSAYRDALIAAGLRVANHGDYLTCDCADA